MTLDQLYIEPAPDGLYAFWMKVSLDVEIEGVENPTGWNYHIGFWTYQKGVMGDYPDWMDKVDESEIKVRLLEET